MSVTKNDVKYVAMLAHLQFGEDELNLFTQQMNKILEYFDMLANVDTANIAPSSHAVDLSNAFREDSVKSSIPIKESLKNAPDSEQSYFKVPKIIEV